MDAKTVLTAEALLEAMRSLMLLQRQIVRNLYEKGPGLLLELAVRLLKFPEEVSQPIRELYVLNHDACREKTTWGMYGLKTIWKHAEIRLLFLLSLPILMAG